MPRGVIPKLEQVYAADPVLLRFYRQKLLLPDWAGELSSTEKQFIKATHRTRGKLASSGKPRV